MFATDREAYRKTVEKKLVEKFFPEFALFGLTEDPYFEGRMSSNSGRVRFLVRVVLVSGFPEVMPELYVWDPLFLRTWDGSSLNAEGISHYFHTLDNGPGGRVQICHTLDWDPSITCVQVILKARLWIEAYDAHLTTGKAIADYFVDD